jgi:hypothetical protein
LAGSKRKTSDNVIIFKKTKTVCKLTFPKVSLGNWHFAMSAVAEFDSSITTGKVRADELFAMLDIFRDHKISSLQREKEKLKSGNEFCIPSIIPIKNLPRVIP